MLKLLNLVGLLLAVVWLARSPDWEPAITSLGLIGTIIAQEIAEHRRPKSPEAVIDESLSRKERVLAITRSLSEQKLTLEQLNEIEERLTTRRQLLHAAPEREPVAEPLEEVLSSRPMSQAQMNRLAAGEADYADRELDTAYNVLLTDLADSVSRLQKLAESQERWLAFRESQARLAASEAEGGSMAPLLYSVEYETLTRDRIAQLKRTL